MQGDKRDRNNNIDGNRLGFGEMTLYANFVVCYDVCKRDG